MGPSRDSPPIFFRPPVHKIPACFPLVMSSKWSWTARKVRQTPFDGFFGPKFHILTPRWLPTVEAAASKSDVHEDLRVALDRESSLLSTGAVRFVDTPYDDLGEHMSE
jgi:hypothetical protein